MKRGSAMSPTERWLLESDPSIRWQVMRDVTGASADEVAAERSKVATKGFGARLLAPQSPDGRWGGVAWNHGCVLEALLEHERAFGERPQVAGARLRGQE